MGFPFFLIVWSQKMHFALGTPNESGSLACGTQRGINGVPSFLHDGDACVEGGRHFLESLGR